MTRSTDAVMDVLAGQRGLRPYSLHNQEAEQVLNIALALLVELSASNDRIDRLERLLADTRGISVSELRQMTGDDQAASERQDAMEAMQLRVLRILTDPRQDVDGHPDARTNSETQ